MPEDTNLTKDGVEKQKTGPKPGSHHQRGKAIKHSKAGKEAISALSGRVAEIEKEVGLVEGPSVSEAEMYEKLMKWINDKGMSFPVGKGTYLHVYDINRETVWLITRSTPTTDHSHCRSMALPEFFRAVGMGG